MVDSSAAKRTTNKRRRNKGRSSARDLLMNQSAYGGVQGVEMGEDVDPATGLINLADLMLVFACGLLLSLVAFWQIDLGPQVREVSPEKDFTEVSDIDEIKDMLDKGGSGYSEVGTVYKDPETGKLYVLTDEISVAGGGEE